MDAMIMNGVYDNFTFLVFVLSKGTKLSIYDMFVTQYHCTE